MGKYMILDLETETHSQYKRKANAFLPQNFIVMRGFKVQGDTRAHMQHFLSAAVVSEIDIPADVEVLVAHNAKFELLYEKRFSPNTLHAFFKRGGRIWCTQYAEYLLRGQQQKYQMCSLDSIIESYGGRKKIDGIKALWDAGVLTSQIDPELLEDYLIGTVEEGRNSGDIGNTELIYLGQIAEAETMGMTPAIHARMDGLCCTSDMEFNGIQVDIAVATADLKVLSGELDTVNADLQQYVSNMPDGLVFNWGSNTHVSCIIFGGTVRYQRRDTYLDEATGQLARLKAQERWPLFDGEPRNPDGSTHCMWWHDEKQMYCDISACDTAPDTADANNTRIVWGKEVYQDTFISGKRKGEGKFKSVDVPGELKQKYQDFFHTFPGYTTPDAEWKLASTDGAGKPIYGTGADIMDRITKRDIPFLQVLGRYNKLSKEIGTYYVRYDESKKIHVGMLTCVDRVDHRVHHKLNHTSTVTTRLSSSDPNFQNLPRGDKSRVKAMMVSRFKDGVCGELDYSQLEVVVQGLLSGDPSLCRDLNNKIDFHCKRVSMKFDVSYEEALKLCKDEDGPDFAMWKKRRTGCKEFSFQRAYGAGAAAIADTTGMDIEDIKVMIAAEEKEYPGIIRFNTSVEQEVNRTSEPFRDGERGYRVFRRGTWQSPTGCLYSWRTWDAPAFLRQKGITDTYSPPELKNYPVQGTGGEIVQLVLGYLWRWFVRNDNFGGRAYLTNTVHDCVWVDMHPDVVDTVIPGMKKIMEAVPQMLKLKFGIDCPVPFPVDAEVGANMLDMHHYQPKGATQ